MGVKASNSSLVSDKKREEIKNPLDTLPLFEDLKEEPTTLKEEICQAARIVYNNQQRGKEFNGFSREPGFRISQ